MSDAICTGSAKTHDPARLHSPHVLTAFTREAIPFGDADESWVMHDGSGGVAARCSLWWRSAPSYPNHRVGLIGAYEGRDCSAAVRLLGHACDRLAEEGCTLAVGPMDGNTWSRYRLVTERGSEPSFFMEPDNPPDWPAHFGAASFEQFAGYVSALCTDLHLRDPWTERAATRAAAAGIRIRTLDPDPANLTGELRRIHAVSLASFKDNLLYSPLAEDAFLARYAPLRQLLCHELVFIAEHVGGGVGRESEPVAFLFALPDILRVRRGGPADTVIFKTIAVLPEWRWLGLSGILMARCQERAAEMGFKRAIHALMHEDNQSRRISERTAAPMRRYALYAKEL